MVPMRVLTLIATGAATTSILVLEPIEESGVPGRSRVVPIYVGVVEAFNLGIALEETRFGRPTSHDLLLDALTNLDATIDHVLINDMRKGTFFAQLTLSQHGRLISLDSRPSDAVALAIRQSAPIYMEEDVLNRTSFPYLFNERHDDAQAVEDFKAFLESVVPDDFAL